MNHFTTHAYACAGCNQPISPKTTHRGPAKSLKRKKKNPEAIALMQGVKHLMDPKGILNPYKVGLYKLMSSVYP
jgi:hypothetical protein